MSTSPQSELEAAHTALVIAAEALWAAADMLADVNADRFADRGGVGRPPKDRRAEGLYALANGIDAARVRVETIREELA